MKLRIRGNSVRLRVTKGELEQVLAAGKVADSAQFGQEAELHYQIEIADAGDLRAEFSASTITVYLPRVEVDRWAAPDQVSITGEQAVGDGKLLAILVEKDFECLEPRSGEDASELFANPLKTKA